jgi:predicted nucleic acid-binding protein
MSYLLDTDWAVSFLNGRPNAVELVGTVADDGIAISIVTCGEVFEGLLSIATAPQQVAQFTAFVNTIDILVPDLDVAHHYAKIRAELRSRGLLIADNDLWIAATALANDLTLVTRDQHFARVSDLKLYSPT